MVSFGNKMNEMLCAVDVGDAKRVCFCASAAGVGDLLIRDFTPLGSPNWQSLLSISSQILTLLTEEQILLQ